MKTISLFSFLSFLVVSIACTDDPVRQNDFSEVRIIHHLESGDHPGQFTIVLLRPGASGQKGAMYSAVNLRVQSPDATQLMPGVYRWTGELFSERSFTISSVLIHEETSLECPSSSYFEGEYEKLSAGEIVVEQDGIQDYSFKVSLKSGQVVTSGYFKGVVELVEYVDSTN